MANDSKWVEVSYLENTMATLFFRVFPLGSPGSHTSVSPGVHSGLCGHGHAGTLGLGRSIPLERDSLQTDTGSDGSFGGPFFINFFLVASLQPWRHQLRKD